MALVEHYGPVAFNSTPELLPQALRNHANAGGNDWVNETFGPLFRKHGVDNLLGLALLHHHFTLEEGELLTDVREFSMDGDESTVNHPNWAELRQFLEELSTVFVDRGVGKTYGLVRYPGDDFPGRVEMTVGRANVNLTPKQVC
ncbi:hypothetical protein N0V84_007064 [Fusarium piperis]|uniref:Uncharacterized protein n=1 Tax=Fusarium piperis TaxID=1435070 RepID=A0A9W8WAN3_9HYPO|nr:hypothetical protein N0V84_007064 [Fusarium piperis]